MTRNVMLKPRLLLVFLLGCGHRAPDGPSSPPAATAPGGPGAALAGGGQRSGGGPSYLSTGGIGPFVDRYCAGCHSGSKKKGGVSLDPLRDEAAAAGHGELWQLVLERIEAHDMPPEDSPQPTDDERALLARWVEARVFRCDEPKRPPRGMTVRRLNRTEYETSIRDLLGVDVRFGELLPGDNSGHGFDNMAEALTTSPLLVERYLEAADRALAAAVFDPALAKPRQQRLRAAEMDLGGNPRVQPTGWVFLSSRDEDEVGTDLAAPGDATFLVRLRARMEPETAGPQKTDKLPPHVTVSLIVDDAVAATVNVSAPPEQPATYEVRVPVPPGRHRLRVATLKDKAHLSAFERAIPRTGRPQPARVALQWVEIEGPVGTPPRPTAAHERIFFRAPARPDDAEAARAILERFAARAFRRPATPEEVERLVGFAAEGWKKGLAFEAGVRLALRAVLVAPQFLFRHEIERATPGAPATDYALATRLSYFLWSSLPDEELLAHAARGTLRANLRAQVARMLAHPRSRAFVDGFGGQWLEFRTMEDAGPAPQRFKTWDENLRHSMRKETELLFEHVLREDRSALDILGARYTFVNERLARHYGFEGISGEGFRQVSLEGTPRRGVLTHGSVLTLTSNPTRTSPVKRGKWVLEVLLNTPPPPPPPDVPSLPEGRQVAGTVRERLEQHRADPGCATCHARMDPIGFAFENFDGIGAFRTDDNGEAVDAKATLPTGETVEGALPLIEILIQKKRDQFLRALAAKMLTYALGRGLGADDRCTIDWIARRGAEADGRLSAFVTAVAESAPFLDTQEAHR